MKADPEQRAVQLGEYIAAHNATVRAAAAAFGCSKSTVHKDVAVRSLNEWLLPSQHPSCLSSQTSLV